MSPFDVAPVELRRDLCARFPFSLQMVNRISVPLSRIAKRYRQAAF
jgi:hypothetical protein